MDALIDVRRMVNENVEANIVDLQREFEWLGEVLNARFRIYFGNEPASPGIYALLPPDLSGSASSYAQTINQLALDYHDRLALALALAPHLMPRLLDVFYTKNANIDKVYTEFGGLKGVNHGGFIPTGETLAFVISGDNLYDKFKIFSMFHESQLLNKEGILSIGISPEGEPFLSGILKVADEFLEYLTIGHTRRPDFNANFPAKYITTSMEWADLVLGSSTKAQIEEIETWIEYGDELMIDWEMKKKLRPGYRTLFYGPPGTGKTLTACLLGKATQRDVYRIDLSMIISKYIGETEKNLARVFDKAENKRWILFFDEADALFGKRTDVSSSKDRFANQEVSYLLQRIEVFDGIVILASNLKSNIDEAFTRRFESMVYFPLPKPLERLRLWKAAFSAKSQLQTGTDLQGIAQKYELSGGSIMNVVRFASLQALKRKSNIITQDDLITGIGREYAKEGKTV